MALATSQVAHLRICLFSSPSSQEVRPDPTDCPLRDGRAEKQSSKGQTSAFSFAPSWFRVRHSCSGFATEGWVHTKTQSHEGLMTCLQCTEQLRRGALPCARFEKHATPRPPGQPDRLNNKRRCTQQAETPHAVANIAATSNTANPTQVWPTWREALKGVVWLLVHNEIETSVSGQLCTVL